MLRYSRDIYVLALSTRHGALFHQKFLRAHWVPQGSVFITISVGELEMGEGAPRDFGGISQCRPWKNNIFARVLWGDQCDKFFLPY